MTSPLPLPLFSLCLRSARCFYKCGSRCGMIVTVYGRARCVISIPLPAALSNCTCLPSFGHFEWGSHPFLAKKGCFGAQNAQFWEGTS